MQANWIWPQRGASIRFVVAGRSAAEVFTTRPDTLARRRGRRAIRSSRLREKLGRRPVRRPAEARRVENRFAIETEKEGFDTGASRRRTCRIAATVWIANYVLMGYARSWRYPHDQRDFGVRDEVRIPIVVIRPEAGPPTRKPPTRARAGW